MKGSPITPKEGSSCPLWVQRLKWPLRLFEFKLKVAQLLQPVMLLGLRFWLGWAFWKSVVLKLPVGFLGVGKGDWSNTLLLFQYEYHVPYISPVAAAYMGTAFEFLGAIMLFSGLGARFGATILLVMAAVIELTYIHASDHIHWMLIAGTIMLFGPGLFSIDAIIRHAALKCKDYRTLVGIKEKAA